MDFSETAHIRKHHIILEGTPLEKIGVNMITHFPLDAMHLGDLGVTEKLLNLKSKKGCNDFVLSDATKNAHTEKKYN